MKYKAMAAFAAVSAMIAFTQPGFTNHHQATGEGLELGLFNTRCCGTDTASAQTVHLPQHGFAVQLTVTDPSCCNLNTFAQVAVENLNDSFPLFRSIIFNLTGQGGTTADVSAFVLHVDWFDAHGQFFTDDFTVANGGLIRNGNQFALNVNNHHTPIQPGSRLSAVDFRLNGNCSSALQVLNVQNVFIDTTLVNYEVDHGVIENESSFCSGNST